MPEKIVQLNEEVIKGQLKELVRGSVEETLNELLEAEANKLTQAARYERNEQRQGYRSGHYNRNLTTTSGDVTLKVPKLKGISFETAIIERYRRRNTIQTLLKMSRLPTKAPKTFETFDFSLLKGKDVERLKVLPSLNAIYSHRNLAFIGPAGTGKTHLAQAFGYACCQHGLKTYFIKASELRDRFTAARRSGKTDSCLNGLVRPSCLIIDEIGHCAFDKENTRLFFDLIDRRYNKEGSFNMIFTSNKNPALWREDFEEDATLLCTLDRIFDDATVFKLRGESFRGKKLETVSLQTGKIPAVELVVAKE